MTAIKCVDRVRASSQQNFPVSAKHGDAHDESCNAIIVLLQDSGSTVQTRVFAGKVEIRRNSQLKIHLIITRQANPRRTSSTI